MVFRSDHCYSLACLNRSGFSWPFDYAGSTGAGERVGSIGCAKCQIRTNDSPRNIELMLTGRGYIARDEASGLVGRVAGIKGGELLRGCAVVTCLSRRPSIVSTATSCLPWASPSTAGNGLCAIHWYWRFASVQHHRSKQVSGRLSRSGCVAGVALGGALIGRHRRADADQTCKRVGAGIRVWGLNQASVKGKKAENA